MEKDFTYYDVVDWLEANGWPSTVGIHPRQAFRLLALTNVAGGGGVRWMSQHVFDHFITRYVVGREYDDFTVIPDGIYVG